MLKTQEVCNILHAAWWIKRSVPTYDYLSIVSEMSFTLLNVDFVFEIVGHNILFNDKLFPNSPTVQALQFAIIKG